MYVYYSHSGKKTFGMAEVAKELDTTLLKLKGSHGIRWAAASEMMRAQQLPKMGLWSSYIGVRKMVRTAHKTNAPGSPWRLPWMQKS